MPVSATRKPCAITAASGGDIVGVRFEGESSSDYYKNPVVWTT